MSIDALYNEAASHTSPVGRMYSAIADDRKGIAGRAPATMNNPYYAKSNADFAKYWSTTPAEQFFQAHNSTPYPGAPHDGGAQDLANTQAIVSNQENSHAYQAQILAAPTWYDKLAMALAITGVTAGVGAGIGGFAADAATAAGASTATAGTVGAVAGGVSAGALAPAIQGQSLGNIGKGALIGGIGGGLGSYANQSGAGATLADNTGMSQGLANGLVKTGVGATTGAVGGALNGRGAGAGAAGGALSAGAGAVGGSIFNSGNTVPTSGTTDVPAGNMSYDFSSGGSPSDPVTWDSSGADGINYTDPMAGMGGASTPTGGWLPTDSYGNVMSGGGSSGGGNGSILGSLAKYLSGGSGGGISPGMLQSLFGLAAQTGGGILDSNAAKGAAGQYANQSKFTPYGINGPNGSTSFNGNTATSTLSLQEQQLQKMLQGLGTSSGKSLAAGPQGAINSNFNALQSADLQAQQRLLGNTQNNEFSNGILGSTAGGYQTQGALQAIGAQTGQNYNQAVNQANTQQQQQLAQLTGSLNGMNGINSQMLQQLGLGAGIGADASNANRYAYQPSLAANSKSNVGAFLTNLGNSAGGG